MSGPSQPKVEEEQWSDERIGNFLTLTPIDQGSADYHVLREAYQHMTAAFFVRFLAMFKQAQRDPNAKSAQGETILDLVSQHRRSGEYATALRAIGAKLASEL